VESPLAHEEVSGETMDDFLTFTMEAGTFGHFGRDAAMARLKNERSADDISRVKKVLQRTFPEAKAIEKRYTYLQDKPWLLPVAWGLRIAVYLKGAVTRTDSSASAVMRTGSRRVELLRFYDIID
jgi:hypothetical protein